MLQRYKKYTNLEAYFTFFFRAPKADLRVINNRIVIKFGQSRYSNMQKDVLLHFIIITML